MSSLQLQSAQAPIDLKTLLEFINPDRGGFTCVGWAHSKDRRCRNPISRQNQQAACSMLIRLPDLYHDKRRMRANLQELAGLSLCKRYHQDQAFTMMDSWHRIIASAVDGRDTDSPIFGHEDLKSGNESRQRQTGEKSQQERRWRADDRRKTEEDEREAARREEQAQREREESRRRAEEARQQREAHERAEENRRKLKISVAEFAPSWTRYDRGWQGLERTLNETSTEAVENIIPWPVKSGRWQDVNESNVRTFFKNAPDMASGNERRFLSVLRRQSVRWHEDRLRRNFRRIAEDVESLRLATLVQQVLNDMKGTWASL